jgi:hypothetical protein
MKDKWQTMNLNGCAESSRGPVQRVPGVVSPGQHSEVVGAPSDAS